MIKNAVKTFGLIIFLLGAVRSGVISASYNVRNTHGNLLFDTQKIRDINTKPEYAQLRKEFLACADKYLSTSPVDQLEAYKDYRGYEFRIENFTMAYLITGNIIYFNKTVEFIEKIASYPDWLDDDLNTSHFIMGLSSAYDYLYDLLDPELRGEIREKLLYEMERKFNRYPGFFDLDAENTTSLLGNHRWANNQALYAGAIALRDEIPADLKEKYINTASKMFIEKIIPLLPADGTGQEGTDYSLGGLRHLLKFMEMKRLNEGIDLYASSEYFRNIMYYMMQTLFPNESLWVNVGDSSHQNTWSAIQPFCYRFAAEFNDTTLQTFAQNCSTKDLYSLHSLMWFDPSVITDSVELDIPKAVLFETGGEIAYRTAWDKETTYIYFTCGSLKTAHGHPDRNQFLVYHNGNHLLVDQSYSYWKNTAEHNTLLVNGYGQIGENYVWLPGELCSGLAQTRDFFKSPAEDYIHFTGDAANSYRPECELELYLRHITILNGYILVIDEVKAKKPKTFEIRFHNADVSELIDTQNRFELSPGNNTSILQVNNSQILFRLDKSKTTSIEPTFTAPPYEYPGKSVHDQYEFLRNYQNEYKPYTDSTVMQMFDDIKDSGYPPLQHGFHLSQKTDGTTSSTLFKNLLIVREAGSTSPEVKEIETNKLTGYELIDQQRKIIYLLNKTENLTDTITYGEITFKGKMVTAILDHQTNNWTFYTKQAEVIPDEQPPDEPVPDNPPPPVNEPIQASLAPIIPELHIAKNSFTLFKNPVEFDYSITNNSIYSVAHFVCYGKSYFHIKIEDMDNNIIYTNSTKTNDLTTFTLEPGESRSNKFTWDYKDNNHNTVPPGKYKIYAVITTEPEIKSAPEIITIQPNSSYSNKFIKAYPNPSRGNCTLVYQLHEQASEVILRIYSTGSQLVKELSGDTGIGFRSINWNGKDKNNRKVASGVYILRLSVKNLYGNKSHRIGKLVIIR